MEDDRQQKKKRLAVNERLKTAPYSSFFAEVVGECEFINSFFFDA
ncbi:hypothetical protein [Xylanibacter brevis]|nr:hypothetical protein [Xylanibacter brevis]